ncbi:MAG: hypothetical protein DKINENOH_01246 [bacterium]|nr:hypothetical protein [bacterium]
MRMSLSGDGDRAESVVFDGEKHDCRSSPQSLYFTMRSKAPDYSAVSICKSADAFRGA